MRLGRRIGIVYLLFGPVIVASPLVVGRQAFQLQFGIPLLIAMIALGIVMTIFGAIMFFMKEGHETPSNCTTARRHNGGEQAEIPAMNEPQRRTLGGAVFRWLCVFVVAIILTFWLMVSLAFVF